MTIPLDKVAQSFGEDEESNHLQLDELRLALAPAEANTGEESSPLEAMDLPADPDLLYFLARNSDSGTDIVCVFDPPVGTLPADFTCHIDVRPGEGIVLRSTFPRVAGFEFRARTPRFQLRLLYKDAVYKDFMINLDLTGDFVEVSACARDPVAVQPGPNARDRVLSWPLDAHIPGLRFVTGYVGVAPRLAERATTPLLKYFRASAQVQQGLLLANVAEQELYLCQAREQLYQVVLQDMLVMGLCLVGDHIYFTDAITQRVYRLLAADLSLDVDWRSIPLLNPIGLCPYYEGLLVACRTGVVVIELERGMQVLDKSVPKFPRLDSRPLHVQTHVREHVQWIFVVTKNNVLWTLSEASEGGWFTHPQRQLAYLQCIGLWEHHDGQEVGIMTAHDQFQCVQFTNERAQMFIARRNSTAKEEDASVEC